MSSSSPTTTTTQKQIVAIAGASDLAKYLTSHLLSTSPHYEIHILTRADRPWFASNPALTLHITDYSQASLTSILTKTRSTILFSFLHSNDPKFFNTAHIAMLEACDASPCCKRFVPSEYGGNLTNAEHASFPRFYRSTHGAVREALREYSKKGGEVKWTLVNGGWFMDYFVPPKRSYMKSLGKIWPLEVFDENGEVEEVLRGVVPGTGEERISWTAARDVTEALARLVDVPGEDWEEEEIYVCGEVGSWNGVVGVLEKYYGKKFEVTYIPVATIEQKIQEEERKEEGKRDAMVLAKVYMDEWNYSGASAVPWDRVLEAREKYFPGIRFRGIEEFIRDADRIEGEGVV